MRHPFHYLVLLLTAGALQAAAFDASLTVQPPLIPLNGTGTIAVEVRGVNNPPAPALPSVPGLRIVQAGQSQRINWVNGRTDRSVTFSFTVYPERSGEFTIPAFDYAIGEQTRTLGPGRLEVVPATTTDGAEVRSWDDMLFAKIEADREMAYVGEAFELTLSVYSQRGIHLSQNLNLSNLPPDGWIESLQWHELPASREVIDNRIYERRQFRVRTRAARSGRITFAPRLQGLVEAPAPAGSQRLGWSHPLFDSLYDSMSRDMRPVEIEVQGTGLLIRPLPDEGRPDGFSGGVGQFRISAMANPVVAEPGDPITVTVRISGDGGLDRITAPDVPDPDRFRLFGDPIRRLEGDALFFEMVVSPRTVEVRELPPIALSFFDPEEERYRTVFSDPVPLTIRPPGHDGARLFADRDPAADPPPLVTESEMQRIRQAVKRLYRIFLSLLYVLAAALLALAGLGYIRRLIRRRQMDTARLRRLHAPRSARKGLRAAQQALRRADFRAVDEALWQALTGYFGNRLNLPPGEVTADDILRALTRIETDRAIPEHLEPLLGALERRRYGAGDISPDAAGLAGQIEETSRILRQCEKVHF